MSDRVQDEAGEIRAHSALRHYDVDFGLDQHRASRIAVEVFWPQDNMLAWALFCVPGGGMNRRFFDLQGGHEDAWSFARQMAGRGLISILVDPPGLGDSDGPETTYDLPPDRLTHILQQVYDRVCADLRAGEINDDLPALPALQTIGVGHSMGALLTILQQQAHGPHSGLALLGFGMQGLPQYVPQQARDLLDDPAALRAQLPALAQQLFNDPWPDISRSGGADFYGASNAEADAKAALRTARDKLLAVPAFLSMLPGNVAPEAAELDVPVFLALGENDLVPEPEAADAGFVNSPDVQLQMLPDTGHSFFLFSSRSLLFDRVAQWVFGLMARDAAEQNP